MAVEDNENKCIASVEQKISNVKFCLNEFNSFMERVKVEDAFRLQILQVKFVGSVREKLVSDEELNSEKDYAQYKKKISEIFQKREAFIDTQA